MLYYVTCLLIILYAIYVTKRTLHMLQQNLYNENNRYLKWINKNLKITIMNYSLLLIVVSLLKLKFNITTFAFITMIIMCIVSCFREKEIKATNQNKKPLVYTSRIKRLIVTISILYMLPILLSVIYTELRNYWLVVLSMVTAFSFYTTFLALIINAPIEK